MVSYFIDPKQIDINRMINRRLIDQLIKCRFDRLILQPFTANEKGINLWGKYSKIWLIIDQLIDRGSIDRLKFIIGKGG